MTSSSANNSVFVAGCPLQVATGEHPLTAIVEPERVAVVSLPDGALLAEIGLSDEAEGVDVAWLGSPPRLVVVSRLSDHTLLHLLDVGEGGGEQGGGVRLCSEKRVDASLRLVAVNGNYGMLAGTTSMASSTAILTRSEDNLSIHPVPARAVPSAAGALGSQLVVAFTNVLELWDPVDRVAKRRLKLPRPTQIRAIGGSDRQIWLTTTPEPQRLEVLPLVNRGQPLAHELPEPIGSVASHPKLDVVVCAGADTGRLYVIDLDGRMPTRELSSELFGGRPMAMSMVGGRLTAIVAVAGEQRPRLIGLDGTPVREWPAPPPPPAVRLEPQMPQVPYIGPPSTARTPSPQLSTGGQIGAGKPAGQGAAAGKPANAAASPAPATVYDSKLGQSVAAPPVVGEPLPRATILGAATPIARTPRPSTQNESTHAPAPPPASPAAPPAASPAAPPVSTSQMIDRLQSWRDRQLAAATSASTSINPPAAAASAAPSLGAPAAAASAAPGAPAAAASAPSLGAPADPPRAPLAPAASSSPPSASRSASLNASGTAVVMQPPGHAAPAAAPPLMGEGGADGDEDLEELEDDSAGEYEEDGAGEPNGEEDDEQEHDGFDDDEDEFDGGDDDDEFDGDDDDGAGDDVAGDDVAGAHGQDQRLGRAGAGGEQGLPPGRQPAELMAREELAERLDDISRMRVPQIMDTWAAAHPATEARVRFETSLASARALGALVDADWRGALADWTRALARKSNATAAEVLSFPLSKLMRTALARLGLTEVHAPMLNLLYGSRLLGRHDIGPAEIVVAFATALSPAERWREALGGGEVAASGAVRAKGASIRLTGALRRFLDELPPKHGALVAPSGPSGRSRPQPINLPAVLALDGIEGPGAQDVPPQRLAKALSSAVGTAVLMVARPLVSERQLRSAALEARLREALAVIPYPWIAEPPAEVAAIYLAPTAEIAASTGLPLLSLAMEP